MKQKTQRNATLSHKKRYIKDQLAETRQYTFRTTSKLIDSMEGACGTRRGEAILRYADRAEADFAPFGLDSVFETFVDIELLPCLIYDRLNYEDDLSIAAALWILTNLRHSEAYSTILALLPDVEETIDEWCLPIDFYHPCFSNELIESMIYILKHRYKEARIITDGNIAGKDPSEVYKRILSFLPKDAVKHACSAFKTKVWDMECRTMRCSAFFRRGQKEMEKPMRSMTSINPLLLNPGKLDDFKDVLRNQIDNFGDTMEFAKQEAHVTAKLTEYLKMDRRELRRELKSARLEHRELADLREILFNSDLSSDEIERREQVEGENTYPYETKKRTVVFGGHDTFLKAFKPMFANVRFVDANNLAFDTDIIKYADVVWIQNNCIAHGMYWSVVKRCKQYDVQMRYFGYASAEKCAEQLVKEDVKN